MVRVVLATPLGSRINTSDPLMVEGKTASEILREVESRYAPLRGWILDEQGRLREHVNIFVNDARASLDHPVSDGDELYVLHAISGG